MSSLFNMFEAPVATLQQQFKLKRGIAVAIIAVTGTAVSLSIQGIVSGWMDVVSIYICPLGAMIAGVMFFWVFGKEYALDAVNESAKKKLGNKWFATGKYVYVIACAAVLILGAIFGGIG